MTILIDLNRHKSKIAWKRNKSARRPQTGRAGTLYLIDIQFYCQRSAVRSEGEDRTLPNLTLAQATVAPYIRMFDSIHNDHALPGVNNSKARLSLGGNVVDPDRAPTKICSPGRPSSLHRTGDLAIQDF